MRYIIAKDDGQNSLEEIVKVMSICCSLICNKIKLWFFKIKLSYFSFQPVLHNWYNKGCGMCYPVCGMVHIKQTLAANWKE